MVIAISINYIPNMDVYMKQSLATSLSIFVMVKLGLTHPPAGASALVFSGSNQIGFMNMVFTLLGVIICVLFSALINNTQSKRQYPTFWGIWYLVEKLGIDKLSIKL